MNKRVPVRPQPAGSPSVGFGEPVLRRFCTAPPCPVSEPVRSPRQQPQRYPSPGQEIGYKNVFGDPLHALQIPFRDI